MCPVWLTPDKCRDGFAYPNHDILCSRPVAKGWRNAFTAPPVGSFCNVNVNVNVKWLSLFWLSLSSPPGICILCEKGGHWLTRFSKFVLFSCPFLDLCWQFCLQTIHGVNITPIKLSSPVISWCCGRMQSPNDVIQKIEKSLKHWYSHHNTATMGFPNTSSFSVLSSSFRVSEFHLQFGLVFSTITSCSPALFILCCGARLPLGIPIKIAIIEK